jgi:hypothetical protein
MLREMALIAFECLKNPKRRSVWVPGLGKYVCPKTKDEYEALAHKAKTSLAEQAHLPPIDPKFKLVFVTAAGGTFFFIALCLVLTFFAGKDPPSLFEKVVTGLLDLAKIGFGAVAGLLGGKQLAAEKPRNADGTPDRQGQASVTPGSDSKK